MIILAPFLGCQSYIRFASYIASQLYYATHSDIVLRTVKKVVSLRFLPIFINLTIDIRTTSIDTITMELILHNFKISEDCYGTNV